ncbi:MAG TPA: T9SS type A sorting domain-containing protein [Rubricoccaceae bacterium]|nr:T9SS type A sorting domain-containing protein [Rubricoccaceae bacterium]
MPRPLLLALALLALAAPASAQWIQLNGPLPPSVGGFAEAGGVMVMGTGQSDSGDVYRSTDGGRTWTNALLPNGGVLAAHAAGSSFFVGTYISGAHRSDDGGRTWARLDDLGASIGSFAGATDRLFAGGDGFLAPAGVFRSTDGGFSWMQVLPMATLSSRALYAEGPLALAGGSGAAGLYRSTNGGDTWAAVPAFTGSAWTVGALAAEGATLFAGVSHSTDATLRGVYRSTDGGQTWAKVSTNLPPQRVRSLVVRGATALAITAPSDLLFGTLHRSTDGGVTWTQLPPFPGVEALWTLYDGGEFWLGTDRGAFRSTDGLAWAESADGAAAISGVASLLSDGDALLVGLTSNGGTGLGLWRTEDLGATWTPLTNGLSDRANVRALHREGATLFAGQYGSPPRGVYRSDDGGDTWALSASGISAGTIINDIHGHDGVLLVGAYEALYRSTDGGFTWATVPGMDKVEALASYAGAFWAGRTGGFVYRSTDGGLTWAQVGARLDANGVVALAVSRGALYAATRTAGVFRLDLRSPSAGAVAGWTHVGRPSLFLNALLDVSGVLVLGSALDGLFFSTDGGGTWLPLAEGYTGGEIYALAATSSHLVVGTRGHALWAHPLGGPGLDVIAEGAAEAPGHPSLFPNPVPSGRTATLAFHLPEDGTVAVTVYDALGRRVGAAAHVLEAGAHRLPLDVPGLAPGVYLVRVEAPGAVTTARLTVRP